MTKSDFCQKHTESYPAELLQTTDVLMRIASNLSDLHIEKEFFSPEEIDQKLNSIKSYIFDYMTVLRIEQAQTTKA